MLKNSTSVLNSLRIILLLFVLIACEKPSDKLIGIWEMTSYRINNNEETKEQQIRWHFSEEGEFIQVINHAGRIEEKAAQWKTNEDITRLIITYSGNPQPVTWNILQMDDSILKLDYTIPGFYVEREFRKMEK